jgi:hypothetical protein
LSNYFDVGNILFDLFGMERCYDEKGDLFCLSLFYLFFTFLAMLMLELGMFSDDFLQVTKNKDGSLSFTLKSQADACDFFFII